MVDYNVEITAAVSGAIISIFWLAGLSFAVRNHNKLIDNMQTKHDTLDSEIRNELSRIGHALGRIEGKLSRDDK